MPIQQPANPAFREPVRTPAHSLSTPDAHSSQCRNPDAVPKEPDPRTMAKVSAGETSPLRIEIPTRLHALDPGSHKSEYFGETVPLVESPTGMPRKDAGIFGKQPASGLWMPPIDRQATVVPPRAQAEPARVPAPDLSVPTSTGEAGIPSQPATAGETTLPLRQATPPQARTEAIGETGGGGYSSGASHKPAVSDYWNSQYD